MLQLCILLSNKNFLHIQYIVSDATFKINTSNQVKGVDRNMDIPLDTSESGNIGDINNTANGHIVSNHSKTAVKHQQQQSNTYPTSDDEINHETLPYNWDSGPAERTSAPSGFRDLFIQNWHPTLVYCAVFWSFGICVAILGPTLLDLGCQTSSDMKESSWVFFFQLCCTLIGSVFAGFLSQRYVFCCYLLVLL